MKYPPAESRDDAYIWVTWLPRLLAGESHCLWAAWFKAHNRFTKRPTSFDFAPLNAQHTEMVAERKEELTQAGYAVFVESQNKFSLRSQSGRTTIGGQADIVAINGQDCIVEDCKTRGERQSHYWQVLIYMLLLPFAIPRFRGKVFRGQVIYHQSKRQIAADAVTPDFKRQFRELVDKIGGDQPPPRVPSITECGLCDISEAYCPERIMGVDETGELEDHDLF